MKMDNNNNISKIISFIESGVEYVNNYHKTNIHQNHGSIKVVINEYSRRMLLWGFKIQEVKSIADKHKWLNFDVVTAVLGEFEEETRLSEIGIDKQKLVLHGMDKQLIFKMLNWAIHENDVRSMHDFSSLPDPYYPLYTYYSLGGRGLRQRNANYENASPYFSPACFDESRMDINTEILLNDMFLKEANDIYFTDEKLYFKKYFNKDI